MKKFFVDNKKLIIMCLFTAVGLLIWRFGTKITLPAIDPSAQLSDDASIFGFLDIFTGGALSQFSILALGISPYITASIVIQLLQMDIVPAFKEWAEEGEAGKAKLNQWTRYIALLLAFVNALTLIVSIANSNQTAYYFRSAYDSNVLTFIYLAIVLTAGTAFTMWLADQLSVYGVGNGGSMLIVAGIVASIPAMFTSLAKTFLISSVLEKLTTGQKIWSVSQFIIIVILYVGIIAAVVWMEGLQRKIPVQYANRPGRSQMSGRQSSDVPIKLNSASVIPVIFASTLMSIPLTVISFVATSDSAVSIWFNRIFGTHEAIGFALFVILIFVFTFFYSYLQVSPEKISENLKNQNAYINGVKPGEETAVFISKVLFKVTLLGATYLAVLASVPTIISLVFGLTDKSISIGGTGIMIVVGVAIETAKQIKTQSEATEYKGFL